MKSRQIKTVVIGGGTGTFTILSGLKKYDDLQISAIISMADNGGSNRIIRDEFGLLPTSDLRQCMVALSTDKSDEILRKLFTYRYLSGTGISGMTFGNLFMAALSDIFGGDQKKAIEETCRILSVKGKLIPVTFEMSHLLATYSNGKQILGEHEIDEPESFSGHHRITNLEILPKVKPNKDALVAIHDADLIVLGPGDLYTSILPNVVVPQISEALNNTHGKILYVLNIMTKYGQTVGFKASDFLAEVTKYLNGRKPDFVLVNTGKTIPREIMKKYKEENAEQVKDDLDKKVPGYEYKVIRKDILSSTSYVKPESDKSVRSLIRHDSSKLARAVHDLAIQLKNN